MADKVVHQSSGIGVFGLLGVAFVVLKLLGIINWSWWWVLAPFWGPFVIAIVILLFLLVLTWVVS